jgi:multimeric flavodoxin WrbA
VKILALVGSPRKKGNTDILVDQILRGSGVNGHTSEKLYLYGYNLSPCVDCRSCKKGEFVCILKDDMQGIYPKMEAADLVIFATPLYWWGPSGPMKLLMDRMRPFVANGKFKGKKAAVVVASGDDTEASGPLVEMFRLAFDYLKVDFVGHVLAKAYEKGEISQDKKALQAAYNLGTSL